MGQLAYPRPNAATLTATGATVTVHPGAEHTMFRRRTPHPTAGGFFASIGLALPGIWGQQRLWPGGAQPYKTPARGEICGRPYDRVQAPGRLSEQGANGTKS